MAGMLSATPAFVLFGIQAGFQKTERKVPKMWQCHETGCPGEIICFERIVSQLPLHCNNYFQYFKFFIINLSLMFRIVIFWNPKITILIEEVHGYMLQCGGKHFRP